MITHWTLEEVASWGRQWMDLQRDKEFLCPHPGIWPKNIEDIPGLMASVLSSFTPSSRRLFSLACLASLCLSPNRRELAPLLTDLPGPMGSDFPLTIAALAGMDWIRIPIFLADTDRGELRFVLLGRGGPGFAARDGDGLDAAARQAVQTALTMARAQDLFCWPIVESANMPVICGPSLGLPVYLGARLLRQDLNWPAVLACTGGLSKSKDLLSVENVPSKAKVAVVSGYKAFFYPEHQPDLRSDPFPAGLHALGVQTLDEAWSLVAYFAPEHAVAMTALFRHRREPAKALDFIVAVPVVFLEHLAVEEPDFRNSLQNHCRCPEHAKPILNKLDSNIATRSPPLAETSRLLNFLFPSQRWQEQALHDPDLGLTVCRLHVEAANHQGRIDDCTRWEALLRQVCARLVELRDTCSDELLIAIHVLVGGLHNRYTFSVQGVEELLAQQGGCLKKLNAEWQSRRQRTANACHDILGRYHGTLAQHYGFCGPDYLDALESHVRLAQEAFGNGQVPRHRSDWKRGFSSLFHAYLDAGRLESIQGILERYLDRSLDTVDFNGLNAFEHFHLAKFFAFTRPAPGYQEWSEKDRPEIPADHPWQLWALNMGKAATDREKQRRYLNDALRICRANKGPTIRAMALLALAHLAHTGLMEPDEASKQAEAVVEEIRKSGLSQEHFAPLLGKDGRSILECVLENEAGLFPFGYR